LRTLADDGHREAKALLAAANPDQITPSDSQAAAWRLCKPTSNSLGHYAEGTVAIDDSLLARVLPADVSVACIRMLLQNARSPYEGASNRRSYPPAAANLSEDLESNQLRLAGFRLLTLAVPFT
jgi:hypothetical protein